MHETARLLRDLVRIPSINPMGRVLPSELIFEKRVADYLEAYFRALGVRHERHHVADQRDNILAFTDFTDAKWTWLWEVHQDTVPVDGMTIDPFGGVIDNGQLYGRGACDVKGTMATMLDAFARLVRERPPGAANVVLACTVDEEYTSLGVKHLVQQLAGQGRPGIAVNGAIVAEPTKLQIVNTHKGVARWELETEGKTCHSSRPNQGVNAIYAMARLLPLIESYAQKLQQGKTDPILGAATLSVGTILGGTSVNTVPGKCRIEIDRRLLPGEDPSAALHDFTSNLTVGLANNLAWRCQPMKASSPPLSAANSGEIAARLGRAIDSVVGTHTVHGVPFGTDASTISAGGIPAVIFGPGDIALAHTAAESIPVSELELASEILYRVANAG